jgi:hypothetical protein
LNRAQIKQRRALYLRAIWIGCPLYLAAQILFPIGAIRFILGLAGPWLALAVMHVVNVPKGAKRQHYWVWVWLHMAALFSAMFFWFHSMGDFLGGRTLWGIVVSIPCWFLLIWAWRVMRRRGRDPIDWHPKASWIFIITAMIYALAMTHWIENAFTPAARQSYQPIVLQKLDNPYNRWAKRGNPAIIASAWSTHPNGAMFHIDWGLFAEIQVGDRVCITTKTGPILGEQHKIAQCSDQPNGK